VGQRNIKRDIVPVYIAYCPTVAEMVVLEWF